MQDDCARPALLDRALQRRCLAAEDSYAQANYVAHKIDPRAPPPAAPAPQSAGKFDGAHPAASPWPHLGCVSLVSVCRLCPLSACRLPSPTTTMFMLAA